MTTKRLYRIADKDNIFIANMPMKKGIKAFSAMYADGECAIAIDYSQIESEADERVRVSHELGHCETGAFYTAENYLCIRSRCEYRADKWAIKKLLPKDDLEEAFNNGYVEVWQLAELFGVTEDLIKKALWIYFDKQI